MNNLTGVIGHPIEHSKSPLIHNYWLQQNGIEGVYEAFDFSPDNLKAGIEELINKGYKGFNVTVPHKEAMLELCDNLDLAAQKIGAVNTVVIKDGKLQGCNTDAFGFVQNIKTKVTEFDFAAGTAVVLGAGGAARAVLHGLIEEGAQQVFLLNRTEAKAQHIAKCCSKPEIVHVLEWKERSTILQETHLLVNTTVLGMVGQPALEIDLTVLPETALVTDVVYTPLQTQLLQKAALRGNPVVSGIGMLLHQARPAFEAWHGILPEVTPELEGLVRQ